MALVQLDRERSAPSSPTSPTTPGDWIATIRSLVSASTDLEEKAVDGAGTPKWTEIGPVAGSPNVDQRWVIFASAAGGPVDLGTNQSANANDLYIGYAPNGGASTLGDPAVDATLYTGGTAIENRFTGFHHYSRDTDAAGGYSSFRLISSNEDLWLYALEPDGDVHVHHSGACIEPDGLTAEADGRIHGFFTCSSGVGGGVPLADNWLSSNNINNGRRFLKAHDPGADQTSCLIFDPAAPATLRTVDAIANRWNMTTQSQTDDAGIALVDTISYRYTSGASTGKVGKLRNTYVWGKDLSMREITTSSGATVVGWLMGPDEASAFDCVIIGRAI